MQNRYIIEVDKYDWEIREDGLKRYRSLRDHTVDAFGIVKKRGGVLAYVYDAFLSDEDIERAKKDPLFKKDAIFVLYVNGKEIDRFEGCFIDALMCIKKIF